MSLDQEERRKLREFGWAVLLAAVRWVLGQVARNPGKEERDGDSTRKTG